MDQATRFHHAEPVALADIPALNPGAFRGQVLDLVREGGRITALFGRPQADQQVRLFAVLAFDQTGTLAVLTTDVTDGYEALTSDCPQAHWFEREIAEQWGIVPRGHPWLKPIRFHHSYRPGHDAWGRRDDESILPSTPSDRYPFFRVAGDEIHEVAVGPVHAGVIEPGHFRFQCHGEHVFHLEISLGYQHRGIERNLIGGPDKRTLPLVEQIAGDTSIGHTTAYCQAIETLAGCEPSLRAHAIRGIALELERLANHVGDLGALANDVGFLPTSSYCGRLRGDFLNATALICGNRFGRGLVKPGGAGFDLDPARIDTLSHSIKTSQHEVEGAVDLLWRSLSVQSRFEDMGIVTRDVAEALGLVGPVARASGINCDVRRDFPRGIYCFDYIPDSTGSRGDVQARALVRTLEIRRSCEFLIQQLAHLVDGPIRRPIGSLAPDRLVVSLVEGWRGEICHVVLSDGQGRIGHYKIVDPSFHNWIGMSMALRNQQISDFPLCNKSFNLSYCGHDL